MSQAESSFSTALKSSDLMDEIKPLLSAPVDIKEDENLISLGLDSMKIMKLLNGWRKKGFKVSFAELMENPTIKDWIDLLNKRFGRILKKEKVTIKENEFFPLTDVQYAYFIGRSEDQVLGGVGCHAYLEIDGNHLDKDRLFKAWEDLKHYHPMLNTVFSKNGEQKILNSSGIRELKTNDFTCCDKEKLEFELEKIRKRLSHRVLDIGNGETAGLELSLLPDSKTRLHFDLDLLIADVMSLQILLRDLNDFYSGSLEFKKKHEFRFDDYLKNEKDFLGEEKEKARKYWMAKLESLPMGPELPLVKRPQEIDKPEFKRRSFFIEKEKWERINKRALENNVTPAMVLLTSYADILERWSKNSHFLINIPLFDRKTEYDFIENAVADFTNLLLMEVDFRGEEHFLSRVLKVQSKFHESAANSACSAVEVQREISRMKGHNEIAAPIVFSCNLGTPLVNEEFQKNLGKISYMISQTPQVWLDYQVYEKNGGLLVCWDTIEELFPENMMDNMFSAYESLMNWLADKDESWNLKWNNSLDGKIDCEPFKEFKNECLHWGFFENAEKNKDNIAIEKSESNESITYGELSQKSLSIASYLKSMGIEKQGICISLKNRDDQITAVMGSLAAECFYVPVAHDQPYERRKKIYEKAGIKTIITDGETKEARRWPQDSVVLDIKEILKTKPCEFSRCQNPLDTAYVIFTSGSTGEPKGVEISHESAFNTISDINSKYNVNSKDRLLSLASLDFDLSVYDIFGILGSGGKLITIPEDGRKDAKLWMKVIEEYNVTIWNSVPVLLEMFLTVLESRSRKNNDLRLVMLSGDWISEDLVKKAGNILESALISSMGGATEASIWSNFYHLENKNYETWRSIPYGKPMVNQKYRIVDEKGRDCPFWVEGELWIGGKGVAKGYIGDVQLTNQAFPVYEDETWYKTGDLGRLRPCGNMEFLGRKDFQLKIRGHRIEAGEVEAALKASESVADAVVVKNFDSSGLEAGVILKDNNEKNLDAVVGSLKNLIPEFMIPSKVIAFEKFPLNKNGKKDRKEISRKIKEFKDDIKEEFFDDLEEQIALIWKEVLNLNKISVNDNFFQCGGDSLKATRIIEKLISDKIIDDQLSLGTLFKNPTIKQLAKEIREMTPEEEYEEMVI